MNPIRIINNQALGQATTMPGMKLQPQGQIRRNFLGQMGPTIGGEELAYRAAVANLEGIKKAFPKLVVLVGEPAAQQALDEAKSAVEKAQEAFVRQIPRK
jgi:hypothetical protein